MLARLTLLAPRVGLLPFHRGKLVELLIISAEETILPNTNRRAIAETCLVLYQVLRLQDEAPTVPESGR